MSNFLVGTLSRNVECLGKGNCRRMSNFLVGTLSRDVYCLGMGYWRGISCVGGNISPRVY